MGQKARPQHGFSRMQLQPLIAYLKGHFSLDHVEPFLLFQVEMQGRSAWDGEDFLHDEEAARGLARGHLEEN